MTGVSSANGAQSPEVDLLRTISARLHSAAPPSKLEIEDALERGFAALMTLEARLYRAQAAGAADAVAEPGPAPTALKAQIDVLRDALSELRLRTSTEGSSGLTPGFVLPGQH